MTEVCPLCNSVILAPREYPPYEVEASMPDQEPHPAGHLVGQIVLYNNRLATVTGILNNWATIETVSGVLEYEVPVPQLIPLRMTKKETYDKSQHFLNMIGEGC